MRKRKEFWRLVSPSMPGKIFGETQQKWILQFNLDKGTYEETDSNGKTIVLPFPKDTHIIKVIK